MKKYISIVLTCLLVLSCETSFLDRSSIAEISSGSMWTTETLAEAGMAGITYPLYKSDLTRTQIRSSDYDGINRPGIEGSGFCSYIYTDSYPLTYLSYSAKRASDIQISKEWSVQYTVIHACNDAIDNLIEDVVGTATYQRYLCEARILRAFCYARINMLYGGVPLYLESITNEECTKAQSSFTEVWEAVIEDCTFAIENENCPDNTISSYHGSPSKGMAYAIRGMAYMWLASNRAVDAAYSDETVTALSDSEVEAYYALAAADFEAVAECGYGLWTGEWSEFFTEENEQSQEMIYPLQFESDSGYSTNWQMYIGGDDNYVGWQNIIPNPDFVDDYQWADGTEFSWTQIYPDWEELDVTQREVFFLRDSLYDIEDKITRYNTLLAETTDQDEIDNINTQKNYYSTLGTNRDNAIERIGEDIYEKYYDNYGNEALLRSAYDDRDPRLDATVVTPYTLAYAYDPRFNDRALAKQLRWPLKDKNKYDDDADYWSHKRTSLFYVYRKYNIMDDSLADYGTNARQRGNCDWPLLRYTQVYLLRAEAYARLGRLSEAKAIVDEIRERAGMPATTASTEEEMIAAIQYESRVELCQEGINYFDEIRWGTFYETKFQGADICGSKNLWGDTQFTYKWYYVDTMWPWSVPSSEVQMNANLKTRDGWTY